MNERCKDLPAAPMRVPSDANAKKLNSPQQVDCENGTIVHPFFGGRTCEFALIHKTVKQKMTLRCVNVKYLNWHMTQAKNGFRTVAKHSLDDSTKVDKMAASFLNSLALKAAPLASSTVEFTAS